MRFFYYFLRNKETGEKKEFLSEQYIGEPGEECLLNDNGWYVIEDYAEEWEDFDEPEDF